MSYSDLSKTENPATACPDHAPDQSGQAFGLPATHAAWADLSGAGTPFRQ
ncbi:MAG: hypothetical protein MUD08_11860 [Cytophagales bacterium]|nr:hypothetical protein [Cytophagales bacterium]